MDLKHRVARILAIAAVLTGAAQAQFLGYVSDQTTNQVAFTAQASNGSSVIFNNIGQAAHSLSYCMSGFIGTVSLLGSNDGTFVTNSTAIPLSQANYNNATTACKVLPAGGYYPALKAQVTNYLAGTVTAWYNGIGSPVAVVPAAVSSTGPTTPISCDQTNSFTLLGSAFLSVEITHTTLQSIWICSITVSVSAPGSASGVLTLWTGTGTGCATGLTQKWQIVTASTAAVGATQFFGGSFGAWMTIPPATDVCMNNTATTSTYVITITFAQGFSNP